MDIKDSINKLVDGKKELDSISKNIISYFRQHWPYLFGLSKNNDSYYKYINVYNILYNINKELLTMLRSCVKARTSTVKLKSYFIKDGSIYNPKESNYYGRFFFNNVLSLSQDDGPKIPYESSIELFTSLSDVVEVNGHNALHFYCDSDGYQGVYSWNSLSPDNGIINLSNIYEDDKLLKLKGKYKDGLYIELYDSKQLNKDAIDKFFIYLNELLSYRKQCVEWVNDFNVDQKDMCTYDGIVNSLIEIPDHKDSFIELHGNPSFGKKNNYSYTKNYLERVFSNVSNNDIYSHSSKSFYDSVYDKNILLPIADNIESISPKLDLLNSHRKTLYSKLELFNNQLATENLSFNAIRKLQGKD